MSRSKVTHRYRSKTWRAFIPLLIIFFLITNYFDVDLVYIYYYLVLVVTISFAINFAKFAEISVHGVRIFTLFPYLWGGIEIPWNNITKIKPSIIVRMISIGGIDGHGGRLEPSERSTISICLKEPMAKLEKYTFQKNQKRFFFPKIEIRENGLEVVMIRSPQKGYKNFVKDCSKYVVVESLEDVSDYVEDEKIINDVVLVIGLSAIFFVLMFFYKAAGS